MNHEILGALKFFNLNDYKTMAKAIADGAAREVDVSDMHGSIIGRFGTVCTVFEAMREVADCFEHKAQLGFVLYDREGNELERDFGVPITNVLISGYYVGGMRFANRPCKIGESPEIDEADEEAVAEDESVFYYFSSTDEIMQPRKHEFVVTSWRVA
jgi:hypothetical protein